jgi:hypothetical protein
LWFCKWPHIITAPWIFLRTVIMRPKKPPHDQRWFGAISNTRLTLVYILYICLFAPNAKKEGKISISFHRKTNKVEIFWNKKNKKPKVLITILCISKSSSQVTTCSSLTHKILPRALKTRLLAHFDAASCHLILSNLRQQLWKGLVSPVVTMLTRVIPLGGHGLYSPLS